MELLTVNVGSSSVKLRLIGATGEVVERADPGLAQAADVGLEMLRGRVGVGAVAHRIVHGGSRFTGPVVLGPESEEELEHLSRLAPLHNPPALSLLRHLMGARPRIPQVACFDTAFHHRMPAAASTYALPREWSRRWGLRRFGFHGLSHAWASRRAAQLLGRDTRQLRLVSAHIGSGASLAAVSGGASVDTTMGFTPLEGLVMSTRAGTVDPGLVLWLIGTAGLVPEALEESLERHSGLLGLSGASGDLRVVLERADLGDPDCRLAYSVYLHRLRGSVAAMAAATGGTDAVVFTGGAGERSGRLRADVCATLGFLGIELDPDANASADGDGPVSVPGAPVAVLVVKAREDLEMARQAYDILAWGPFPEPPA